jgi:hypothetical protein
MKRVIPIVRISFFCLPLLLVGCTYTVSNEKITPKYICESDSTPPVATWDYSGPKANVEIHQTKSGDVACSNAICSSGARKGRCVFNKVPKKRDGSLLCCVFKKKKLKGVYGIGYDILSGSTLLGGRRGTLDWSEPYKTTDWVKVSERDENGNLTGNTITVEVEVIKRRATKVTWEFTEVFSPRVKVERAYYIEGVKEISLEGPGINGQVELMEGNFTPGNLGPPAGIWYGRFDPPLEVNVDLIERIDFTLGLMVRCMD